MVKALDPANQIVFDVSEDVGVARLGVMNNQVWHHDPKRLVFTLARYKFVTKMLSGKERVLEVGCGDAFGSRIVQQEVGALTVVDVEPLFVDDIKARMNPEWPLEAAVHDMLESPVPSRFDAAYCLDVLEHIPAEQENRFLGNLRDSLVANGVAIIGMPSLESQRYASEASRIGHVNCKSGNDLKTVLQRHFQHVFLFSMNDEVVHTGFLPMAHYLLALCCDPIPMTE